MMQWLLPELVAAQVAQHLSPRDLSACCGVSRHWRLIFNTDQVLLPPEDGIRFQILKRREFCLLISDGKCPQQFTKQQDLVWKPLCDPYLEELLRTTPCVVEPPFFLPEPLDSTLAPVCQWRAAFLREQHLQSNYRSGNYKTAQLKFEEKIPVTSARFVSDDFLMIFYRGSVELLDVRSIPPISVDKLVISSEAYSVKDYRNGFVILQFDKERFYHVLKVDSTEGTITSKYWIYITKTSGSPEMVLSCSSLLESNRGSLFRFKILTTSGTRCIVYQELLNNRNSFHIFDLERGVKVREQFGPLNLDYELTIVGPKKGCNNCHDVLVFQSKRGCMLDLKPEQLGNVNNGLTIHCYVYNVERLVFWPFKHTYLDTFDLRLIGIDLINLSAIMNNFVALAEYDDNSVIVIKIFNYQTGDQIHLMDVDYVWPALHVIDSSCLLLVGSMSTGNSDRFASRLHGVILKSGVVKDVTGELVGFIKVIGRRLVIIESRSARNTFVIWHITQGEKQKFFETAFKFNNIPLANQAGTRLTYKTYIENKVTQRLVYLW